MLDGAEIAAILVSRNVHILRVADVIPALNVVIFLTAACFLGVKFAMYSILTYFVHRKNFWLFFLKRRLLDSGSRISDAINTIHTASEMDSHVADVTASCSQPEFL